MQAYHKFLISENNFALPFSRPFSSSSCPSPSPIAAAENPSCFSCSTWSWDQADCWKLFVQLWNFTNTSYWYPPGNQLCILWYLMRTTIAKKYWSLPRYGAKWITNFGTTEVGLIKPTRCDRNEIYHGWARNEGKKLEKLPITFLPLDLSFEGKLFRSQSYLINAQPWLVLAHKTEGQYLCSSRDFFSKSQFSFISEHTKNKSPSNRNKHEEGQARKQREQEKSNNKKG